MYKEIYSGCMKHQDMIMISAKQGMAYKSFGKVMKALTDDNPLLYFLNQSVMEMATDSDGRVTVIPQYFFSMDNVEKYNQKIQDTANKLIYDLKLMDGSEEEKVKKVHDYMCRNVKYDHEGADLRNVSRFITSHNIMGVFAHKKAQCEGIAKAAKVLLNAVDVKCIYVGGKASSGKTQMESHGWNIVSIDGQPYHLDITFDIGAGNGKYISYDYYNLTDAQMKRDHVFGSDYPRCKATQENYFVKNGLAFSSLKPLLEYAGNTIRNGKMMLYFRTDGKLKVKEVIGDVENEAFSGLSEQGKTKARSYRIVNDAMNTCRIVFM